MKVKVTRKIENRTMGIVFAEKGEIIEAQPLTGEALAGAQAGAAMIDEDPDFVPVKITKYENGEKYVYLLKKGDFEAV